MADTLARYRIVDEPRPNILTKLTVAPFWPFLAVMLFGVIGFLWFAMNAISVGSATKARQLTFIAVAVIVYWALLTLDLSLRQSLATSVIQPYLFLIPMLWRLGCGYVLFTWQSFDVELFEHFDDAIAGHGMIGLAIVFGCTMLLKRAVSDMPFLIYLVL